MGKEYVKDPVPRNLPAQFLGNPYRTRETICAIGIPEEIKEDEGDTNDSCDIMVEDVERLRKILTPPIHALPNFKPIVQPYTPLGLVYNKAKVVKEEEQDYDIPLHEHVMQPLTPQTVHITPPDDNYVASSTNPILNKHLKESGEEFVDNTRVSKKIDRECGIANATIAPGMFKLDIEPISHRLKNNRDAHKVYLEKTIENTDTLRVKPTTSARGSKPSGNTKINRITQPPSRYQKNKVEEHPKKVKSSLNNMNSIFEPISNAHVKHSMRNVKFESICAICNKCLFDANHDMCVIDYVNDVNVHSKSKPKINKMRKVWKHTGKVFNEIGYSWKPIGRTFTIVGNKCPLTRITSSKEVPLKEITITPVITQSLVLKVVQIVLWYLDSGCSKHMTENRSQLINFVGKFLGTVRFGNDHIAKIMGYRDYQMKNVTISQVYYVERLGHNLFSVGKFCDSGLEVAFRKHTSFIRDLDGVDLFKGSRGSNLYTLSMDNLLLSSPICLLSKASKTKSWLWHRRLSHLNFNYITSLAKHGLVRGLPKLKY
ncbi:integrase, catalytic region, zinc finger, CCHC-type containing protein [Tanacetum coccineum]